MIRGQERDPCVSSSCCVTVRAPGTARTGSPAGPTSICPSAAWPKRSRGRTPAARRRLPLRSGVHVAAQARHPDAVDRARRARLVLESRVQVLEAQTSGTTARCRDSTRRGFFFSFFCVCSVAKHGEARTKIWQRSVRHPPAAADDRRRAAPARTIRATRRRRRLSCRSRNR